LTDLLRSIDKILFSAISLVLGLFLAECTEDVKIVEFTRAEVERLLTGDTLKNWLRVAFTLDGEAQFTEVCALQTISTFYVDESDSARFVVLSNPAVCNSRSDSLAFGYWRIIGRQGNKDIADKIELVQQGDTVLRDIRQITSLYMTLTGSENESAIEVSYEAIIPD
jgi:hypothetical protein